MTRPSPIPNALGHALKPLESSLWSLFLAWSVLAFVVMPLDIGEAQLGRWISNESLRFALLRFVASIDATWIIFGAAVAYLDLAHDAGLSTARRWAVTILLGSAVLETIGAVTGWPFGPFAYTDRLGYRIGGALPFAIPFLSLVIIVGAHRAMIAMAPRANRLLLAFGTGLIALLTDLNLEPVAWKVRAYWLWYPAQFKAPDSPPAQNYVSWFVAAIIFCLLFPRNTVELPPAGHRFTRAVLVIIIMNTLFLTIHLVRAFRN